MGGFIKVGCLNLCLLLHGLSRSRVMRYGLVVRPQQHYTDYDEQYADETIDFFLSLWRGRMVHRYVHKYTIGTLLADDRIAKIKADPLIT